MASGARESKRPGAVLGAALAVSVAAGACTTTHVLGRLDDPAQRARAEEVIAHQTVYATVTPIQDSYRERPLAVALTPAGLELEPYPRAAHVVVPSARLQYLSSYDHLRGARDGAMALGIPAFLLGFTGGIVLFDALSGSCSSGDCAGGDSTSDALKVGLLFGGVGALIAGGLGACIGALAGHEDRYVPTMPP